MTENTPQQQTGRDRRNYFRIDDTVRMSLRRVRPEEVAARLDRLEHDLAGNFTVLSSLAAITAQMTAGLRRIENRDPDLAAYLRAIDQKIEVIGRAFIAAEPELVAEVAVPVNLSAGGMCAGVEEHYEPGTDIEVRSNILIERKEFTQPDPSTGDRFADTSGKQSKNVVSADNRYIHDPDGRLVGKIREMIDRRGDTETTRKGIFDAVSAMEP